jgi:hypothetical protein
MADSRREWRGVSTHVKKQQASYIRVSAPLPSTMLLYGFYGATPLTNPVFELGRETFRTGVVCGKKKRCGARELRERKLIP